MPRTKCKRSFMPKKKERPTSDLSKTAPSSDLNDDVVALVSRTYQSPEHFAMEFKAYYDNMVKTYNEALQNSKVCYSKIINDAIESMPQSQLNMVLHSALQNDSPVEDQNLDPNQIPRPKARASRTQQKVDQDPMFKMPKARALSTTSKSRNSSRKRSLSASAAHPPSVFSTPSSGPRSLISSTVTPKIMNTPMMTMRRMHRSEFAISMDGSPLMNTAGTSDDIPAVNVPLQGGQIVAILPDDEFGPDHPAFDEETLKYLKTLRQHLEIIVPPSP